MSTPSLRLWGVVTLLLACWTAGCTQSDGVLGRMANHDGIREDGSAPQICTRNSPEVTLQGHSTCTGRLAASRFSSGLCVCNNLQSVDGLTTRGFASGQGPYQEGLSANSGAPVGVNGTCVLKGATDIGGSFSVAGSQPQQYLGSLLVWGDLRIGGNLQVAGITTVARDAWFAGDFNGVGTLVIAGDLHSAKNVTALPAPLVAGNTQKEESITVQPPCACGASDILDIAGLVNAAKTANDNKSFGVRTDVLASLTGPKEWTLPCGRIYLSQIKGTGDLLIYFSGSSALFIDGSIDLKGKLTFLPTAGAELDVFVKDNLVVQGPIALADNTRPAAGRISVGGSQAITLASPFVGNLYAPKAPVKTAGSIEVWGSLFVYDFQGGASLSVVFDRDIATVGTECTAPLPPEGLCTQCGWCYGGSACIRGVCTACTKDSECCGQSVCSDGSCAPLVMVIK